MTLLGAEDHARALNAMLRHGRKPMSMTHGDFDYDYLRAARAGPGPAGRASAPRLRRPLRLAHVRPPRHQARADRGRAAPLPRALLRDVRAPRARARRDALPRPQHDRHAAQPRRGRRRHARLPRHGLSDVLLPAGGVHRQRGALEGRPTARSTPTRSGGGSSAAPARGCTSTPSRSATCAATAPPTALYAGERYVHAARRGRPARRARPARLHRGLRRDGLRRRRRRAARRPRGARASPATPRSLRSGAAWALRLLRRARRRARDPPRSARRR